MVICYKHKQEFSMEYQVSTSMIPCISNTFYTIIRFLFAWWTWIVLGYSLYFQAVPLHDTLYDTSECCLQYWPFYLTYWGLAVSSIYWLCILYLSLRANKGIKMSESCCDRLIFDLMRFTFICGLIGSIVITAIFWSIMFNVEDYEELGLKWLIAQTQWHGATMILMIIEWFLNSLQLRLWMTIYVLGYATAYIGLLVLHYFKNWTDATGLYHSIYPIMDFHTDAHQSLIYGSLLMVAACMIYIIMIMLKRIMMNTCFYKNNKSKNKNKNNKFAIWDESKEDSLPEPSAPSMKSIEEEPGHVYPQLDHV